MSNISAKLNESTENGEDCEDILHSINIKMSDMDNEVEINCENDPLKKPDAKTDLQLTHNKWRQV